MVCKQIIYKGNVYRNTEELSRVINLPIAQLDELMSFINDNMLTDADIKSYIEYTNRARGIENTNNVKPIRGFGNQDVRSVKPIDFESIIKRKGQTVVSTVQTDNPELNKMIGRKLEEDRLKDIERQKEMDKLKKEKKAEEKKIKKEKQRQNKLAIEKLEQIVPRDSNNKIVCRNTAYESIEELCKIYKVTPVALLNKFKSFGNLDDAIKCRWYRPKIFCGGKWYSSMTQLLRETHISKDDILARVNSGLTLEQAVALGPSQSRKQEIVYGGTTYKNRKELCKQLGLPYTRLSTLVNEGVSLEEAIDIVYEEQETGVRKNRTSKSVTFLGVEYKSIAKLADAYGLNAVTLRKKLSETNQVEQAVLEMMKKKRLKEEKTHK